VYERFEQKSIKFFWTNVPLPSSRSKSNPNSKTKQISSRMTTPRISNLNFHCFSAQNNWVSGFCLSSRILNRRKHNVSETGSGSVLR
jgi:hypothetical protein